MQLIQNLRARRLDFEVVLSAFRRCVSVDKKFTAFKLDLDVKEAVTQSQMENLKTESKASSSFMFKGNKVQYEFNSFLLESTDGAINAIYHMAMISLIFSDNYS